MYADVREFVGALGAAGNLLTIRTCVSPLLEITELADRESKSVAPTLPAAATRRADPRSHALGGRALLLTNVRGSDMPVLINAFGSYHRMEMALGCHTGGHTPGGIEAVAERVASLARPELPATWSDRWRRLPELLELTRIGPRRVRTGPCQQVVHTARDIDLTRLPMLRCWPLDGDFAAVGYPAGTNSVVPGLGSGPDWERESRGRYITLAGVHTIHRSDLGRPNPPSRNIGMYRVQLLGRDRLAMHWHMHHDGARHWRSWKAAGEDMPVAIVLGGESVLPYAATAPLPPGISEVLLAGFLNRGGIPVVPCQTVPLSVPANAEIVIEGLVSSESGLPGWDPRTTQEPLGPGAVLEGPFGDHTGFYSLPDRYPIMRVTAITHRRDPIFPATVVGLPPQEDYFMGKATERIFLPLLRTLVHDVLDYDLPMFGVFHSCAFIKIRKEYPLQARRVMHAIWGAGQMAWTKSIFVVDEDVDVHDPRAVLSAATERCHPLRDVEMVRGPLDILDHAAPRLGAGTKIGFDCTRKRTGEEVGGRGEGIRPRAVVLERAGAEALLQEVRRIPSVLDAALPEELGRGWLFVRVNKDGPGQGRDVLRRVATIQGVPPFVVAVGPDVRLDDPDEVMFHWAAHTDAGRDADRSVLENGSLCFDSTPKLPGDDSGGEPVRPWPPILIMAPDVRRSISRRLQTDEQHWAVRHGPR
ncbi:MAG: UbiD family decarboxylase [Phycisphaerae bacterium]|nr:UbiD family decarboxylase [Phycisphaerae bacterium]